MQMENVFCAQICHGKVEKNKILYSDLYDGEIYDANLMIQSYLMLKKAIWIKRQSWKGLEYR